MALEGICNVTPNLQFARKGGKLILQQLWVSEHGVEEWLDVPVAEEDVDMSQVSDGCHTFEELYTFRKLYNAVLFNEWAKQGKYDVHKSYIHNDGTFVEGYFIVVAMLPTGQISNHYKVEDWDLFDIPDEYKAMYEYDNHTSEDVLQRLEDLTFRGL